MRKHFAIEAAGQRLRTAAQSAFGRAEAAIFTDRAAIWWFCGAICLSATLIFSVQPLFAKMALPRLGGSPNVWTTAMLFFQTLLLAGYAYAHWLSTRFSAARQVAIHLCVVSLGLLALPFAAPTDWVPSSEGVTFQLLWLLLVSVGAPFFALSANAPLLQSWYGATGGKGAEDPYFLYAASNIGSFAALMAFPLLLEPFLSTSAISQGWMIGYGLFFALLAGCMAILLRAAPASRPVVDPVSQGETPQDSRITPMQVLGWIALAAAPSSLMLGVTSKIATDIGSFPFVWLAPLALYLATFVIAFSSWGPKWARRIERAHVLLLTVIVALLATGAAKGAGFGIMLIFLAAMFAATLAFHTALVARRPGRAGLTAFYLSMSAGGALGGLFNSLLAPTLFDGVYEYPLAVALTALVVARSRFALKSDLLAILPGAAPIAALALALATGLIAPDAMPAALWLLAVIAIAIFMLRFGENRRRLALLAGAALVSAQIAQDDGRLIARDRSFFGAYEVALGHGGSTHLLVHGTTNHGAQRVAELNIGPERRPTPLAYYYPDGVFAQTVRIAQDAGMERIGVIGLGAGAMACYAQAHEDWVYFEIDPLVAEIARNPAYFSFLADCTPNAPVRIGDARIELERDQMTRAEGFDLLFVDAFSSDAIPLHLLTQEAMALYRDRLNPGGLVAIHLSNRFYDLEGPVAAAGAAAGLSAVFQHHRMTPEKMRETAGQPAMMIVLSEDETALTPFLDGGAWRPAEISDGAIWRDERASVLPYLK